MSDKTLNLSIATPQGTIFDGKISNVNLPGSEGDFEVHPNHASLLSLLNAGIIDIKKPDGSKDGIVIDWGYVKVEEQSVIVLADNAVSLSGDNDSEISKHLDEAKNLLDSAKSSSVDASALKAKMEKVAKNY